MSTDVNTEKNKKKITTKAVALSALVFPGAGHIYLKRYITSIPYIGSAAICTYMLGARIFSNAMDVTQKIINNNLASNSSSIKELLEQQLAQQPTSEIELMNRLSIILFITWVVAIIDCFRIPNKARLKNYKS